MAMNTDNLAQEISDELDSLLDTDDDIDFVPTEETLLIWKAVATAIINHIKNNAEVDDNGTVLNPSGTWSID